VSDWNKQFPLIHITRKDLYDAGITHDNVDSLDDDDMQKLATYIGDLLFGNNRFADQRFIDTVNFCTRDVLSRKNTSQINDKEA
jgi:hypothetical protein